MNDPLEKSAKFLVAVGTPVGKIGGDWMLMQEDPVPVPDLTQEQELGRVLRLVRERFGWAEIQSSEDIHQATVPAENKPVSERCHPRSPNIALMDAAIAAAAQDSVPMATLDPNVALLDGSPVPVKRGQV